MSDSKPELADPTAADPELDELLDSALADMKKKPETAAGVTESGKATGTGMSDSDAAPNMWSEEFIKEAAAQFESNMAAILGSFGGIPEDQITQEQIAQTFSKMAEAAAQVMTPASAQPQVDGQPAAPAPAADAVTPPAQDNLNEVTAAIAQTLQSLNSNTDNLQAPFTDQDLANMFNNFNMDGNTQDGGSNMFVPFMQGMMQSLLSKEVLYPSLKDLVDKYPAWISDNEGKVDSADMLRLGQQRNAFLSNIIFLVNKRYKKQQELMVRVCSELETEEESDAEEVRRKRFETVLELMQQMQELGQPPTELVGELGVPPQGFAPPAGLPGQDAQCSLM